ncbi:MRP-S31 domain containing protein [Trichuris trichiura]|uniref:Small ribosomal subunit protein mS31 n=1 Tax=Trichuris trichiura TaxID=36087 RepID=A0A077Z2F7_TRITR|nr:MRP-S31 domain containing protein [Trichuris trichiura]
MELSLQEPDSLNSKLKTEFRHKKVSSKRRRLGKAASALDEDQVKEAVDEVAENVGRDPLKIKSDLMDRLALTFEEEKVRPGETERLLNLLSGTEFETFADTETMDRSKARSRVLPQDVSLNSGGERLNIFDENVAKKQQSSSEMLIWQELEQLNLKRAKQLPPRNGFEEMIQWTKEGKLYPYPIDNGYLWFENNHHFHEHVFLEPYIEHRIPNDGPIRRFMDLVVHGLSTNPYMSVQKKREHLDWFVDYFQKKEADIERLHAKERGTSLK